MRWGRVLGALWLVCGWAGAAAAQTNGGPPPETIKVFFDCNAMGCSDFDYFRRQVPYVNWMHDRTDADVHVLITGQATGGGGQQYKLTFIGLAGFDGVDETLVVNTPGASTQDEQRSAISDKFKLGLVRYLSQTSAADKLRVVYGPPGGPPGPGGRPPGGPASPATTAQEDPWDYWVFSLGLNAYMQGQSSYRTSTYYGSFGASRTTDAWKLSLSTSFNLNTDHYDLSTSVVDETQRGWDVNSFAVRSVGNQWAVGVKGNFGRSDFYNQRFKWSLQPGVEYNIFPYAQSSRRSLSFQYLVGPQHYKYTEATIYEFSAETRTQESLTARLRLVQPWGQWSTSLTYDNYIPKTSKYHVSLNGFLRVRIFKGFSVRASAYYTWINDQLYLSAEGVTDEQTLLHLRQLHTTHTYFTSFGFSYQFGSIFNNVVNTRFGGNNEGMMIM